MSPLTKRPGALRPFLTAGAALLAACSSARGQLAIAESVESISDPPTLPGHPRDPRGGPPRRHDPDEELAQRSREPETSEEPALRDWFGEHGRPWWEWEHAAGDLGGFRTGLEDAGLSLHVSYTLDWSTVLSGGVSRRAATNSLLDVALEANLETLAGIPGGTAFLNFYSTDGRGQGKAGEFQTWSNAETERNVDQIAELWYQQALFDDRLRFKLGKFDANSEFAFVESAGEFLNASAGFSPTIAFFPTFPEPATGLAGFFDIAPWLYVGAGVFDGAAGDGFRTGGSGPATFFSDDESSDWFIIAETGARWDALDGNAQGAWLGRGRAAFGAWTQTGTLERFDGATQSSTRGFYLLAEQQIWASQGGASPEPDADPAGADRGLWFFFQVGVADDEIADVGKHFGVGLSLLGTFPDRQDDAAGVYFTWADLSDDPGAGFDADESVLECFYRLQLTPWISVKPDLQVIWNPGGDSSIDTTVVGGLRFEIVF